MRLTRIWFWMSCKRCLHRKAFLLILLVFPLAAWLVRGLEKTEGSEIRIAVCIGQDEQSETKNSSVEENLEQQVLKTLLSRGKEDGIFRFYLCENETQVEEDVAARRAECGYVFPSGLGRLLDEKAYKRCIRVYSAPSTVAAGLSSEVVFSAMIGHYDKELFGQYVAEGDLFGSLKRAGVETNLKQEAGRLYDAWMKDGGTFHFEYEQASGERTAGSAAPAEPVLFPVRGIVAVYVFVVGLYSGALGLRDEKRGLFVSLRAGLRIPCQLAGMMGPAALAAVSGLAALAGGGAFGRIWYEVPVMAGYVAAVTLFAWILGRVCRREAVLCSLIPFFLIGSLVFCPVFLDVGRYLPGLMAVRTWFLPWYYLRMF